jgi:hypothetical protein
MYYDSVRNAWVLSTLGGKLILGLSAPFNGTGPNFFDVVLVNTLSLSVPAYIEVSPYSPRPCDCDWGCCADTITPYYVACDMVWGSNSPWPSVFSLIMYRPTSDNTFWEVLSQRYVSGDSQYTFSFATFCSNNNWSVEIQTNAVGGGGGGSEVTGKLIACDLFTLAASFSQLGIFSGYVNVVISQNYSKFQPGYTGNIVNPGQQTNSESDHVYLQLKTTGSYSSPLLWGAESLPPDLVVNTATGLISGSIRSGDHIDSPFPCNVYFMDVVGRVADEVFYWIVNP